MISCTLCSACWRQANSRRNRPKDTSTETGGLIIGAAEVLNKSDLGSVESMEIAAAQNNQILLNHYIFDSADGWKAAEAMAHPTLRLNIFTDSSDYTHINATQPQIRTPCFVNVVTDTGAQSCLWSLQDFL